MTAIKLYADDRGIIYRAERDDDMTAPDNHSALLEVGSAELADADGHLQAIPEGDGWRMLIVVPPHTASGDWQPLLTYAVSMITQFYAIGPEAAGWYRHDDATAPGAWYIRVQAHYDLPDLSFLDDVDLSE